MLLGSETDLPTHCQEKEKKKKKVEEEGKDISVQKGSCLSSPRCALKTKPLQQQLAGNP